MKLTMPKNQHLGLDFLTSKLTQLTRAHTTAEAMCRVAAAERC